MGTSTQLDMFWVFWSRPVGGSDTACHAQASVTPATEREVPEEFDGMSIDLGEADAPEDFGDWKEDYADAVGISSWREL